jgi:hypothetical protein
LVKILVETFAFEVDFHLNALSWAQSLAIGAVNTVFGISNDGLFRSLVPADDIHKAGFVAGFATIAFIKINVNFMIRHFRYLHDL